MAIQALISFTCGGLAFSLLCLGVISKPLSSALCQRLLFANIVTIVWCYANVGPLPIILPRELTIITSELLRNAAWMIFLIHCLPKGKNRLTLSFFCHSVWVGSLIAILIFYFDTTIPFNNPSLDRPILWLMLLTPLAGLILIEQAVRNTTTEVLAGIQTIYIAIAGLFAYDIYFYVYGLFFHSDTTTNIASTRGAIAAIVALLIYFGCLRLKSNHFQFRASRDLVLYSASFIAAGIFLFLVSLAGIYIRRYGGSWGAIAQAIIIFSTSILCLTFFSSQKIRAHLKVLASKHLFKHRYDYREEWLRLISTLTTSHGDTLTTSHSDTLTTSHSDTFDIHLQAIKAMARIFQSEKSAMWSLHDNTLFVNQAEIGFSELKTEELSSNHNLIHYMESTRHIIELEEYRKFPKRYSGVTLPEWLDNSRIWLIIPLLLQDSVIGFIVLSSPPVKQQLGWEDFDLLKTAGLQVASFLAVEQASMSSAESKQFDAYSHLTAFIMHDLKNLIAQQSLVVKNAAKHKDNPEFIEDAIETIDNSVKRMSRLLDQLKHEEQIENKTTICLQTVLQAAVRKCHNNEPRPSLHTLDTSLYVLASNEQLSMILGHIIRNSQEATENNGFIDVSLHQDNEFATIEIEDNGIGMSQDFIRNRLFRPFDSTKSNQGMGIGAYQTREFIRQAGGNVDVISEENVGTIFRIKLPLATTDGS